MIRLVSLFQSIRTREEGASLVEYALLLALIAVVALAAVAAVGTGAKDTLQIVANSIG
ncbi:MAG: Flp family type IVb pilin [Acidimicrobiia bacterium]